MKLKVLFFFCLPSVLFTRAQVANQLPASWRVVLERKDRKQIAFLLERKQEQGKTALYVINGKERIQITDVKTEGDSMFIEMPAFESSFRVKLQPGGNMSGIYIKGTAGSTQYWPV